MPQVKSPILVKSPKSWYILGSPNPLIGNQVKHLPILLITILLLTSPLFGDNHKGETLYGWGNTLLYVWKGVGRMVKYGTEQNTTKTETSYTGG